MRVKNWILIVVLAALAFACTVNAATNVVAMYNYYYSPTNVTIAPGDTVLWTNTSLTAHDTTSSSGLWASPTFTRPGTYSFKFTNTGSYPYICGLHVAAHPESTGLVTVASSGSLPTVAITAPADGSDFSTPATFTFSATASKTGGTITNVQFFAGTTLLGSDASSPYSFGVSNLAAGSYSLTAKATDSTGVSATSSVVRIVVGTSRMVRMYNYYYSPTNLSINAGDTVVWTNTSLTAHDTTSSSGLWASPTFGTPGTSSFRFTNAGSYPYICGLHVAAHPESTGLVSVASSSVPNGAPTVVITNPANGAVFTAPASFTVRASASDSDGSVSQVEFFNGITSLGVDASSPYSASVSSLAAGSYTLSAIATDNAGAKATNSVTITVNNPVVNDPPSVTITNPVTGAVLTAPASFTVQASAFDSDGSVSQVEFFNGITSLGVDASSPYSASVSSLAAGSYTLSAIATDNTGAKATNSIGIIVNAPPIASITGPTNGASFAALASITITANASDSDGSVTNVSFYRGATKLGEDTTASYSLSWSNVAAGTYTLAVIATDNRGATNASAPITITVTNAPVQAVTITTPTMNGSAVQFSFVTQAGHTYDVQHGVTLTGTNWVTFTNVVGSGSTATVQETISGAAQRFYRVGTQ